MCGAIEDELGERKTNWVTCWRERKGWRGRRGGGVKRGRGREREGGRRGDDRWKGEKRRDEGWEEREKK